MEKIKPLLLYVFNFVDPRKKNYFGSDLFKKSVCYCSLKVIAKKVKKFYSSIEGEICKHRLEGSRRGRVEGRRGGGGGQRQGRHTLTFGIYTTPGISKLLCKIVFIRISMIFSGWIWIDRFRIYKI